MLKISKDLFNRWNEANLLYCHWKSNEHLLPGLDGETDLDVLLSKDNKAAGEDILKNLGFLHCKSQYGSRYPGVDDWIGFDKDTGSLIHLHLHYELVTGHKGMKEYSLPWRTVTLKTRVLNEDYSVYTIEPNLELVTLYTRIGLKADFKSLIRCHKGKFKLPKDIKREIDWLKERADMEQVRQLFDFYYGNKAGEIFEIVKKDRIASSDYLKLKKISESIFKKNSRVKCFRRLCEIFFFAYQRWIKKLIRKFYPIISKKIPISGEGISIAFIGQDGSGKSTVTSDIKKWLTWKIEANRFYLGSGDHYDGLMKRLIAKGIKVKHQNNGETKSGREKLPKRKKNLKNLLSSVIVSWNMLMIARRAYCVMHNAEKYRKKGGISLLDRFPQMQFEGISDGPRIANAYRRNGLDFISNKWLAKREYNYFQKIQQWQPSLVFKLMLPPEESIRRKPFENYENVKEKHKITKSLKFDSSLVYEVDATQEYQQELIFIKNKIWDMLIQNQE